ncbi:MAG: glycosyltransferase family 2 protein [Bacteroidetes bacterium]|nr:glycosyltransferase family 2 protein [Bacteroidota bacterium]
MFPQSGQVPIIDVIIPVYNESEALPRVLAQLPKNLLRNIIVCNNGSTDNSAELARACGALVVDEPAKGYGNACLAGMAYLEKQGILEQPDVVVFLDGDYSDYPEELPNVVAPILNDGQDLVIGSRLKGGLEPGAMTVPQRFGNWLAPLLIRLFFNYRFSDLGPFRAIRWQALQAMQMKDRNYGWTVEMQVKAAILGLKCTEVPVRYRKRGGGKSKVSGTIKGSVLAGWKIIGTIFRLYRWKPQPGV